MVECGAGFTASRMARRHMLGREGVMMRVSRTKSWSLTRRHDRLPQRLTVEEQVRLAVGIGACDNPLVGG
jgi:hypothetical protein